MRDIWEATLTSLDETQLKPGHTEAYPGEPTQVKHAERKREGICERVVTTRVSGESCPKIELCIYQNMKTTKRTFSQK